MSRAGTIQHLVEVCIAAAHRGDVGPLSMGEALAAALVLNRPDWLAERGYTILQAMERIGPEWRDGLQAAERAVSEDGRATAIVQDGLARAAARPTQAIGDSDPPTTLDFRATLLTCGSSPRYRDASLVFELQEIGAHAPAFRADIRIRPDDAEGIVHHLIDVHRFAWRDPERGPLDRKLGEQRPRWIDGLR